MTEPPSRNSNDYDLIAIGGGAAGFFGAITCAESCPGTRIAILEKSSRVLGKVKISGGGRCNVTHACFDPRELSGYYPRGAKPLIGAFHRWAPGDTMDWFESRGVPLKIEPDGHVFPQSDSSQSIIDCLEHAARDAGIIVQTSTGVESAAIHPKGGFDISLSGGGRLRAKRILLTTGGTRTPIGAAIAKGLGHRIEPAAPSLFTFKIADSRIGGLQGLSVPEANVRVVGFDLSAAGPVLITHWGLSGPGILRLSAWGARALQGVGYRFEIEVNWAGQLKPEEILDHFDQLRSGSPRKGILGDSQFEIPSRLWKRLAESANVAPDLRWAHLPRDTARALAAQIATCRFAVDGKSMNKDEFVTCGGVALDGVDFKTMESRHQQGLHFAGEVLDIDGITGGFNFQSAWTTGRIAGEAIARAIQPG